MMVGLLTAAEAGGVRLRGRQEGVRDNILLQHFDSEARKLRRA